MKSSTKGAIGASLLSMVHLAKAGAGGPVGGGANLPAGTVTVTSTQTNFVPQWTVTSTVTAAAPPAQTVTATTTVIPAALTQTSVITTTGSTTYTTTLPASTLTTTIQGSAVTTTLPASTITTTAVTTFVTTSVSATTATATSVETAGNKATFSILALPVQTPGAVAIPPQYISLNSNPLIMASGSQGYKLGSTSAVANAQTFSLDPSTGNLLLMASSPFYQSLSYLSGNGQSLVFSQAPSPSANNLTCSVSYSNFGITCNYGSSPAAFFTCSTSNSGVLSGDLYIAPTGSVPSSLPCSGSASNPPTQLKLSALNFKAPSSLFSLNNGAGTPLYVAADAANVFSNTAGHGYQLSLDTASASNPNPNLFSIDPTSGNVTFVSVNSAPLAGTFFSYTITGTQSLTTGLQVVGLDQPAPPVTAAGPPASTTYTNGVLHCSIATGSLVCKDALGNSGYLYSCAASATLTTIYFSTTQNALTLGSCPSTGNTVAALTLSAVFA